MDLPTILSGPILRRVHSSNVYIWLATSKPFQLSGELFQIENKGDSSYDYKLLCSKSDATMIKLGKRLFIHLIKISPMNGHFPLDTLLGYNVFFTNGSERMDLSNFGLLDRNTICYGNLHYPSFYINSRDRSHILYGSCRKFHGKGEDTLVSGDLLVQESYDDITKRPHSLFLLGDQIYADDVADPLFPIVSKLGEKLLGKKENLSKLDVRLAEEPFSTSINQINGRQFIIEKFCGFTSSHASNHVMRFGEYSAMYLLSFGPALWEYLQEHNLYPTFEDELNHNNVHFAFPDNEKYRKERAEEKQLLETRFHEQWVEIQASIPSFQNIRRLLANTPTYMMFDDHDITDDWNLSAEWVKNVSDSPLGQHVITNGLAAYWAFQGYGNSPDSFDKPFIRTMSRYFKNFTIYSTSYHQGKEMLTNFKSWNFVAPTVPKALFLDTRTKRDYTYTPIPIKVGKVIEQDLQGPNLINEEGWHDLTKSLVNSGWKSNQPLIIASPTPLFGIIETSLNSYVYPLRAVGFQVDQSLDYEAWKYNKKAYREFIQHILTWKPSPCMIISGDVHYASSVKTIIQPMNGNDATILQFTSSPIKNKSFFGIWGHLMKMAIWFNSFQRKKKSIHRLWNKDGHTLSSYKQISSPNSYAWKETITFLPTNTGSIIETTNNLGLLSYSSDYIQNQLLTYQYDELKMIKYEHIATN